MGEVVWLNLSEAERHGLHGHSPNMKGWLPSMTRVVIILLRQCDEQLKIGLIDGSSHLTIGY
jgi:hypothetical protein